MKNNKTERMIFMKVTNNFFQGSSKKIILMLVILTIGIIFTTKADIHAATETKVQEVQSILDKYFATLFDTLLEGSDKDYSSNDFSSINGYIIAKKLVNTRYTYNQLLGGIHTVQIQEVTVDDLSEQGNNIEAMVYVKYLFSYGDKEECETGGLYRATLEKTEEDYKVIDLDSNSIEIQKVKDVLNQKTTTKKAIKNVANDYSKVNSYFEKIQENTDTLSEESVVAKTEIQQEAEATETSVSYNTQKARNYGYKLGDYYQNYIFKRASLDCTNFVSQCVWAGYGGTNGYTIPSNPSSNNSTCIALKKRVKSDYRMTSQWYGRNYDSTLGDPPSNFCGVENFYNYVTSNSGNGPKATAYNNNKVYTSLSTKIKKGDVLQFYNSDTGRYYHSVVVVSETDYSVSDYKKVKVAQHEDEYNNRSLSELINNFGGSSCKMRLLRFKSTTF